MATSFTPFSAQELRNAFATRRGTPDSIVLARSEQARRAGIGIYAPEARAIRESILAREAASDARDAEAAREAEDWFIANQDTMVWIVGTNHDTPVAAYLAGADNARLCQDADCCNGVLETPEQEAERLAYWESATPGVGARNAMPIVEW